MAATLKLRRGTSTPSLVQSELFFNTTSNTLIVGDGSLNHTLVKIGENTGNITLTGDISASNLTLSGNATVNGNITFGGSLITFGDSDTDDIVFTGELSSSLIPNDDNSFDIGTSTKRYKTIYAVSASISDINGINFDSFITGTNSFTSSQQNINSLYNSFTQSADSRLVDLEFFSASEYQTDSSSFDIRVNTLETTFSSSVDTRLDLLENFSSSEYQTDSSSFDSRLDYVETTFSTSVDLRLDNTEWTGSNQETRLDTLEGPFSSSVDLRLNNAESTGSDHETRISNVEGYSASLDSRLDDLEATGSDHESRIDEIETTFSSSVDLRLDNTEWTGSNHETRLDVLETTFSSSVDSRLDLLENFSSSEYIIDSASFDQRVDYLEASQSYFDSTFSGSVDSRLDLLENFSSSEYQTDSSSFDQRVDYLEASQSYFDSTFSSSVDSRLDVIEGPLSSSIDQQLNSIHSYTSSLKNAVDVSGQNLTVFGDLTVQGTTTTINTQELIVEDSLLAISSGSTTSAEADGAGFFISGANASILWNHLDQTLDFNTKISSSVGFKGDGSQLENLQHTNIVFDGSSIVSGSSQIDLTGTTNYVSGIKTRLNAEDVISGSSQVTQSLDTRYLEILGDDVVSGSSQIDLTQTTNYESGILDRVNVIGLFSSSIQVNADSITNFDSNVKNKLDVENVHSGSFLGTATTTQLDEGINLYYTDSRVKTKLNTEAVVSSSAQISAYNTFLEIEGDGVVSGSSQIDLTQTTNYISGIKDRLNVEGVLSGSSQVTESLDTRYLEINGDSVISSSQQISDYNIFLEINGDSVVSGSSQIDITQTQNYTSFSSSIDSRLDSVETDQHTHTNKGNLDTIDQNLSSSDTPSFVNLSLTTLSSLGSGEVNAVFSGSAGTLGTRALGTAAFFNVSASVGDDPNSIPTNQAVSNALIAAGAGDLTEFNPTNTFNPNKTGLVHLSSGTEIGGVRGVQGNIHVAIDTGSTHFIDGVNGIVSIGDGVISSSAQISSYGVFAELNGDGLVSSSAQILSLLPSGILSSSNQDFDTFSGSVDSRIDTLEGETHENPLTFNDTTTINLVRSTDTITAHAIGGIVSSSAQLTSEFDTRYLNTNGDNVISGSSQLEGFVSASGGFIANETIIATGTNSVTSSNILALDTINKYLGINQSNPEVTLHMTGDGAQTAQIRMEQYNDSSDAPDIRTRRYRGSSGSPSAVQAGDFLFRSNHEYYNGTSLLVGGAFAFDNTNNANRTQFSVAVDTDGTGANPTGNYGQFKIDGNDGGAITFNNAYKFPTSDGSANEVLTTDGSGVLSFGDVTSLLPNGVVSGSSQVLFNDISQNPFTNGTNVITASYHLVPATNETYDLGSSTLRWRDLYLSGSTIDLGGTLIQKTVDGNIQFIDEGTLEAKSAVISFATIIDKPTLVSGSSQISADQTTGWVEDFKTQLNSNTVISGSIQIDHDATTNFVANEHIDHTSVSITAGNGLTGGGTIAATRTLNIGQGDGISVTSDAIAVDSTVVRTSGDQTIGGLKTFDNIVVNGTGSFAYIQQVTGSAKIIGDAYIVLNNNTPSERFAGIAVYDSGSAGVTASLEFDGELNDWFYEYSDDNGVTTDHGVVLFGPEYSTKGNPTYPTNNRIQKGNGSHHLLDSNITDTGTLITLGSNTVVDGTLVSTSHTIVSQSAQIDHDATTNFVANEHIDHTSVSITAGNGLTGGGNITTSRTLNIGQGDGISVTADAIAVDSTVLRTTGDGVVSGSSQIDHDQTTNFVANEHIDHTSVSITAGNGLTGGGTIAATRTLNVDSANNGIVVNANNIELNTSSTTFTNGVKSKLNLDNVVSGSTFSSPSQGTLRATINGVDSDVDLGLQTNDTVQFGKVGVGGASDATYELKVTGDIGATGDVVAYVSSDKRLKDKITPIENSLQKINKIGGYSFVWNEKQNIYKGKDYGVIAQEIEEILPELVETRENGYKAVKYDRIVSLLIEGVKELSKEVNELKTKIGE